MKKTRARKKKKKALSHRLSRGRVIEWVSESIGNKCRRRVVLGDRVVSSKDSYSILAGTPGVVWRIEKHDRRGWILYVTWFTSGSHDWSTTNFKGILWPKKKGTPTRDLRPVPLCFDTQDYLFDTEDYF